ncbi:MAG: metallophosphoesterase [Planctomycetota bacterium]
MGFQTNGLAKWSRRTILGTLFMPVVYTGYRVAAHNQWIIATRGRRSFDPGMEPMRREKGRQLSLLLAGDTGLDTVSRTAVVEAMRRHASWSQPDAVMLLGDNFYERGVTSIYDPQFQFDFECLFDKGSFDMPFYACLGNHDVKGDTQAQVEYSQHSERWHMPARYYTSRLAAGDAVVDLIVLDTNELLTDDQSANQQLDWLRKQLRSSRADYKIVVGHHPVLTGGQHEVPEYLAATLSPLFDQFKIDLYLSGHDHDLQLLQSEAGWLQVVSGSGSKLRSTSWIDETLFAEATPGFCWLLVDERGLSLTYYSEERRLYTHVVSNY